MSDKDFSCFKEKLRTSGKSSGERSRYPLPLLGNKAVPILQVALQMSMPSCPF